MPKKVTISLSGIVGQIDQATKKLNAAKDKVTTDTAKKELAIKIKKLDGIKKHVKRMCRGLNLIVPTG